MEKPVRPYKFLDFYNVADRSIFFGRRKETETLLADVISARLVVLFAGTGTGKSSLINAGVRPRLSELSYDTVSVRLAIDKDPAEAALQALKADGLLSAATKSEPMAVQLMTIVKSRRRPLVLFFDQFEEFFLLTLRGGEEGRSKGAQFIKEVGTIYRNKDSGVHMVFSLREDYLAEMDAFRGEIPTIFHNDSQLRLRPFGDEQAKKAIEGPAGEVRTPFEFEKGLADRLVQDMPREDGLISLVPLQIVCDTLWRSLKDGVITYRQYDRLGGTKGILALRFEKDLDALEDGQLALLVRLLPLLRTARNTKQRRTFSELQALLKTEVGELADLSRLADRLREMHLVRDCAPDREPYVEWISDYLSALSNELEIRLRLIALRRVRTAYGVTIRSADPDAAAPISRERLIEILSDGELLAALDRDDWVFLLSMALAHGNAESLWFTKATGFREPAWDMMRTVLEDTATPLRSAEKLVAFIGQSTDPQSIELLDRARNRKDLERSTTIARDSMKEGREESRAARAEELLSKVRSDMSSGSPGRKFAEAVWSDLLDNIRDGKCVPILGPGMQRGILPSPAEIAREWAERFRYPLNDSYSFSQVAQYLSVRYGSMFARREIAEIIRRAKVPDFAAPGEHYGFVAQLPLPVYITTDFSDFLARALRHSGKNPTVEICDWKSSARKAREGRDRPRPTIESPLVYHLYGSVESPESLALTEEDLLDFLVHTSRDDYLVPVQVKVSLDDGAALFLGHHLDDWTFQVLYHSQFGSLQRRFRRGDVANQPLPVPGHGEQSRFMEYLERYYYDRNITVFWGGVDSMLTELQQRWRAGQP